MAGLAEEAVLLRRKVRSYVNGEGVLFAEVVEGFEALASNFDRLKETLIALYGDEEHISVYETENGYEILIEDEREIPTSSALG
ncbi:MAG: hypothetical protein HC888_00145 [Candidatus Competibacteraceae bacterium]|nr:hypothetical protein [Candidatus Competibacteraceae bacterium]